MTANECEARIGGIARGDTAEDGWTGTTGRGLRVAEDNEATEATEATEAMAATHW